MTLALGCIADDYTGASDLANTLTKAGLRTVQTIGVPGDLDLPEVDAVVVALKSRSIEAGKAVALSRSADQWLRARGAGHVLFKICSTFDSTDAGNIGPVTDALQADSKDTIVLVTPAFPETGRTVYQGNLFVGVGAAERESAEGSSAQSDARCESRPRSRAAEPQQDWPRGHCDGVEGAPMRFARSSSSLRSRASERRLWTRCSIPISKRSDAWRSIIASRSAHRVSGSVSRVVL